jgi:hypothetical protein
VCWEAIHGPVGFGSTTFEQLCAHYLLPTCYTAAVASRCWLVKWRRCWTSPQTPPPAAAGRREIVRKTRLLCLASSCSALLIRCAKLVCLQVILLLQSSIMTKRCAVWFNCLFKSIVPSILIHQVTLFCYFLIILEAIASLLML